MKTLVMLFVALLALSTTAQANELPVTYAMQFPLQGNWWEMTGFGFGEYNSAFGASHVAVDSQVSKTPVGTSVFAPCNGRVVLSDDMTLGGYGADSSANSQYRGHVVLLECRLVNNEYVTVLLGHVQGPGEVYDANRHRGLVLKGMMVKAGQYVAKVADYWHGATQKVNWHHLHFGIRRGQFNPADVNTYVRGYASYGWSADKKSHVHWVDPTAFVLKHSRLATWHPDGSLVQVYGSPMIYQVYAGMLHHIMNEPVFNAHQFNWRAVTLISEEEFNCYKQGAVINWQPDREFYTYQGRSYMLEFVGQPATCALFEFKSDLAALTWGFPKNVQGISDSEHDSWVQECGAPRLLYMRDGSVVKPIGAFESFDPSAMFVSTYNGVLHEFLTVESFESLGLAWDAVNEVDADDLENSMHLFGMPVNNSIVNSCGNILPTEFGGAPECYSGEEHVSFSGNTDLLGVGACQAEKTVCVDGVWKITQFEQLPVPELDDGIDNDCDGQVDEDFISVDETPAPVEDDPIPDVPAEDDPPPIEEGVESTGGDAGSISCTLTCPVGMTAYFWYGMAGSVSGIPEATFTTTVQELCLRGKPWVDFNCIDESAGTFDYTVGEVTCLQEFLQKKGIVDPHGEGEVWFTTINCSSE